MKEILPWLLPPLAGGLIGYITNAIAIKMLFRPLTEKRVFGIRVPFTPGILPRQRLKLAESIGRMVERELLTPEILRARLASPEVLEGLKAVLLRYMDKIFKEPAGKWFAGVSGYIVIGLDALYPHAAEGIVNFLRRGEIRGIMETQLRIIISKAILNMNVLQRFVISAGQYDRTIDEKIPVIIDDLIAELEKRFGSEEDRAKIIGGIEKEILSLPEKNPGLNLDQILYKSGDAVSFKEKLAAFLAEKILETAAKQTEALLGAINVKSLVSERINSLDMLRVERIILDVLAGQLWWINVFGGILGLLIGIFQAALSRLL